MNNRRNRAGTAAAAGDVAWLAENNAAVRELLDLVARELAQEYVRLVREADEPGSESAPGEETS